MATITIGRELDASVDSVTADQGAAGGSGWPVKDLNKLVPLEYDHVDLTYTGYNMTGATFRTGGASGTVVASLTMAYSGSLLVSVTRT
jgi:hypothetical protein